MNFLGADIGGTHTDLIMVNGATRTAHFEKLLSTPGSAESVERGIRRFAERLGTPLHADLLVHGCTIATNAYLTRTGARIALIVTKGFRDVLEIRDQLRPHLYRLVQCKSPAVVARYAVIEADERIDAFGDVVRPLRDLSTVVEATARQAPEAIAVCLTFAHLNDEHERALEATLRQHLPQVPIYLSSRINPEIEEYPRANTSAIAAYVGPVVERYLADLERRLDGLQVATTRLYMRSDGGAATSAAVRENPAQMLLSGPAGGVIAGAALARDLGVENLITFDMGGTSADFSMIMGGRPSVTGRRDIDGQPVRLPMVDIETISAGGGSIARVDQGGGLRVGPDSAGADPGPACYGKGGELPTVTDAALLLGIIDPADYLGGAVRLDVDLARAAVERHIARPLALPIAEAAFGILALANANMTEAIRALSAARGQDVRRFVLLAFGGAGPIFAPYIARDLGMTEVLVPRNPGVFCALGMLMTDIRHTAQRPYGRALAEIDAAELNAILATMRGGLDDLLARDGIEPADRYFLYRAHCRCVGQFHELPVDLPFDPAGGWWRPEALADTFHSLHEERYGHADRSVAVECVNLRLEGCGRLPRPRMPHLETADEAQPKPIGHREVFLHREAGFVRCAVYDREALRAGHMISGPVILRQRDATSVVLAGQTASVLAEGALRIRAS